MQIIKEHIKQNQYKPVYLLYGSEAYLKKLYRNKLKDGILDGADSMNYSYFEGKGIEESRVIEMAETLPFFAERRLIVIENSGWFKNQNSFADYVKQIPSTTYLVFAENEVDKRSRMYKAVKENGTIAEMNGMDEKNLKLWIASLLARDGKKIAESTILYLIQKSGTDMDSLSNEIEKLVSYVMDREVITAGDVDAVCTTLVAGKIFQMMDAIALKQQEQALKLYYDLLTLREKPMSILFLLTRHFNILLQVKELSASGYPNSEISRKAGVPPFTVSKYITQSKNFPMEVLLAALRSCADTEERVKTGRIADQLGVEMLIVEYSTRNIRRQ